MKIDVLSLKLSLSKRINRIYYRKKMKFLGSNVSIINPLKIQGYQNIEIHDDVVIQYKSWLAALPFIDNKCLLIIGKGCNLGHFNHIYATKEIILEENVLTADKVYISDNLHEYSDPSIPIMNQGIKQVSSVRIGRGSWIGENVCIIGANIGKNCVIGANAVVTKDIPDYSVAVGIPAKVIKKFDFTNNEWIFTND